MHGLNAKLLDKQLRVQNSGRCSLAALPPQSQLPLLWLKRGRACVNINWLGAVFMALVAKCRPTFHLGDDDGHIELLEASSLCHVSDLW